jgi:cholesterol transport system auxiliary component
MRRRGLAVTFAVALASGCSLLSRGAPLGPHYYDPEPPRGVVAFAGPPACTLELGDVDANDDLGQSIAFRHSRYEVGYYETRRWTESPDNYLRRALVRALFDERRCRRVLSGDGPTLDARLLAFDELLGPPRRALVQVRVTLRDAGVVISEATFAATRPLGAGDGDAAFDDFAAAISEALDEVVARVVALVSSTPAAEASPDGR